MFRTALLLGLIEIAVWYPRVRQQPARAPTVVTDPKGLGIRWARIPAGTFQMGCVPNDTECRDDEKPRHAVTLTRDYWLMTTEVTIRMFRAYADDGHGMSLQPEWNTNSGQPIVLVERATASSFCRWIGGRLPTEAEWERAARGGIEGAKYAWGNDSIARVSGKVPANISDESLRRKYPYLWAGVASYDDGYAFTAPVGSFTANPFGLHDMIGNVYEWVSDPYSESFAEGPVIDPQPSSGTALVIRGGSWNHDSKYVRLSARNHGNADARQADIGFRCARDVAAEPAR